MNIIDTLVSWFSPEAAYKRQAFRQAIEENERWMSNYDAAGYDRLNTNWRVSNEPAEWVDRSERDTLRARARDLERNSDILNSVIGAYKRNVYGAGYRLRCNTGKDETDRLLEAAWKEWCKKENCDVTGTQSFDAMMRMALSRKKVDGGILFIKCYTGGDSMLPFKLQAIEVDDLDDSVQKNGDHKVVGGIEYDAYNKPVAYYIKQFAADGYTPEKPRRYLAKDVIFYFTKRRPTQLREVSDMAPTLTRVRDINEFIHTLSVKERILACLSIFIQREVPPTTGRPLAGPNEREYQGKTLTPGMIQYLSPGDKAYTVQPSGQATDASSHIKQQLRLLGSGQGLSYEATSRDMSESNYSSARQGCIEDDLTYEEERQALCEVMDEIYETFVISMWLTGRLKAADFWANKRTYFMHKWIRAPKAWIDPAKEASANETALRTGQKTWADMAAENGKDWHDQIDEIASVLEYADEKGIDLRKVVLGETNTTDRGEGTGDADGSERT